MLKLKSLFPRKGSVLVFSLVVLSFLLVAALSVAVVSVTERRGSIATDRSNRSFQVADSGAEIVLQKIYKGNYDKISDLANAVGGTCNLANNVITGNTEPDNIYKISLYDDSGAQLVCNDSAWRSKVARLKSEGTSGNTVRAVEVAVAGAPTPGITGGCAVDFSGNISNRWGTGCKTSGTASGVNSDRCIDADDNSTYECGFSGDTLTGSGKYACLCVNK
jgi:Tfp pilus assembly protein PilX